MADEQGCKHGALADFRNKYMPQKLTWPTKKQLFPEDILHAQQGTV